MKITLPEHIGEITLEKFQRYSKLLKRTDLSQLDFDKRKIEIFTNIPFQKVGNVLKREKDDIIKQIDTALKTEYPFKQTYEFKGVQFGLIPNFDDISTDEDMDLKSYADKEDELHRFMAILYRPVINKDGLGNYTIEAYGGTSKHANTMKQIPMSIVSGALGFFLNLSKELRKHIQKFTEVELAKETAH